MGDDSYPCFYLLLRAISITEQTPLYHNSEMDLPDITNLVELRRLHGQLETLNTRFKVHHKLAIEILRVRGSQSQLTS